MTTLDLSWNEGLGYVEFVATAAPANYTIYRVDFYNNLIPVANYLTSWWLDGSGTGFGEDYRSPLGLTVTYCLAPVGAKVWDDSYTTVDFDTPGDQAWIRDPTHPSMSTRVVVVDTGEETENVTQRIYNVSGRRLPLVVHDLRQARTGRVTLLIGEVRDPTTGALIRDGRTQRNRLESILLTGNPLLLNMCWDLGFPICMMAVGAAGFTRVGQHSNWSLTLDYTEVDDPLAYKVDPIPRESYQNLLDGVPAVEGDTPPPLTYQDVRDRFLRYIDIATSNRTDQ
jgi:hypothetical protein